MREEFTSQIIEQDETRAQIKVTIPIEIVNRTFHAIYQNIASQVRIPGYKPSKIPRQVVLKEIGGQKALQEEVYNALVNYYTPKVLEKHQITLIHVQVSKEQPIEGKEYVFSLGAELYPQVTLPKLQDIVIETKIEQVTEDMMGQRLAELSMQNAVYVPVDDLPAQEKDLIYLQWVSDPAENILPIDLYTAPPEVSQQLKGRNIDEVFNITLPPEFLEDLSNSNLFADTSSSEVIVKEIKACELPKPDEDFARTLGFDSWAETERKIRNSLQEDLDEEGLQMQIDELLEKLIAKTQTRLPKALTEHHKKFLLDEFTHELSEQEKTLEEYLVQLKKENKYDEFVQDLEAEANKQTKRDLVVETLIREQGITLTKEEFDQSLRHIANDEGITVHQLKQLKGQDWLNSYYSSLTYEKVLRTIVQKIVNA